MAVDAPFTHGEGMTAIESSGEQEFHSDIEAVESIAAIPAILTVVSRVTGMGFSAVARVTPDRWVCLAANDEIGFGLKPGGELKVETTICHEIRQSGCEVAIDHVGEDEVYRNHQTPAMYGFQSYISVPIILKDGSFYGTLCAIDPKPAKLNNPGIIGMFRLFAELIAGHLDTARRLVTAEASLLDARTTAELREQFIAVLGHDLRNPLASIAAGVRVLQRTPLDDKAKTITELMQNSVTRMAALIDDVMDFARARLGGGIAVTRSSEALEPALRQVVDELQAAHPDRVIQAEFAILRPVLADRERVARLLSNLLGNALTYGTPGTPVEVRAATNGAFELSVENRGPAIPPATMERLFAPFTRGDVADQKGLGLGLYIVSQIARAHGGTIDVTSTEDVTCFTFRMPLPAA
ncbi:GAF domain-containing sensor histidine kinase [Bradyrhizobium sp. LTSPM299]|uniref:GAF domain-containing sensor histidine kinase n=1 Tax=Bradyrhizobium sp. LTSPM299 TaxID=1619233 RepID=UPI000ACCD478|nr:GAF domain-containing sensor histidine kinase [Bradyrhizobium sp. LTSPM299]